MAENFLYLTTRGRKSGEARQIEIWFVEHGGYHYLVSEKRGESGWVKNIERHAAVAYSVGTRDDPQAALPQRSARGRIVPAAAEPELVRTVCALMAKKYGWSDGLVVELRPDGA